MKRKQWFAAGAISVLFLIWNLYEYSLPFTEGPSEVNNLILWSVPMAANAIKIQIFSMTALICFVCGFMENKEEKK